MILSDWCLIFYEGYCTWVHCSLQANILFISSIKFLAIGCLDLYATADKRFHLFPLFLLPPTAQLKVIPSIGDSCQACRLWMKWALLSEIESLRRSLAAKSNRHFHKSRWAQLFSRFIDLENHQQPSIHHVNTNIMNRFTTRRHKGLTTLVPPIGKSSFEETNRPVRQWRNDKVSFLEFRCAA